MSSHSQQAGPPVYQPYGNFRPDGAGQPYAPYAPAPYPVQQYPPPLPRGPLPDHPVEYQHMLRGPRRSWWKPLLTLLLAIVIAFPLMIVAVVPVMLFGMATGVGDLGAWTETQLSDIDNLGPAGFLYVNLSLIALIPAAMLSIWAVHGVRPKFLSSVAGGIRWRWLGRCALVIFPLWAAYLAFIALLDSPTSPRPDQWLMLLVIVLLTTPLQAAAEEYFFRGFLMQNFGAWFRNPVVAFVIPALAGASLFALAHGSLDIWIFGDLAVFAIAAGLMTWRTGGLEASIVVHAVNNIGAFVLVLTLGGWQEAFVGPDSEGTPVVFGTAVVAQGIALALILWQAKRAKIDRFFRPAMALAAPYASYPPVGPTGAPTTGFSQPTWTLPIPR